MGLRIVLIGAGGVGGAITKIMDRRSFVDHLVVADIDGRRAEAAAASFGGSSVGVALDASDQAAVRMLLEAHQADVLMNAADPRFVMPLFDASFEAGVGSHTSSSGVGVGATASVSLRATAPGVGRQPPAMLPVAQRHRRRRSRRAWARSADG